MQFNADVRGKRVMVVGMARSGVGSAKLLAANGAKVICNDSKEHIEGLQEQLKGIEYEDAMGRDPMQYLDRIDMIVLSPVVPMWLPFVERAVRMGIEVIGEIELGYRFSKGEFVCITGTNGKTTTTALTGEIFKTGGRNTYVLGNIGLAITQKAEQTSEGDIIVAEVAGFQLESIQYFHARAAAFLNISEDHMDRFKTMEAYIASKCRVFENQTEEDFAVLNMDDPVVRDLDRMTKAKVIYFSRIQQVDEGVFLRGDDIIFKMGGVETRLIKTGELQIPGLHNLENAMAAAALALCMGVDAQSVREALKSFPGVEHRIEFVVEKNGIRYINDSKGTNPDSTIKAVQAMNRPTVLILGGYDKHSDFMPLFDVFGSKIKAVVALGATAEQIIETAQNAGFKNIRLAPPGDFEAAVRLAASLAQPGDNVLLSPACASWDMFRDYEQRGEIFKKIVNAF